MRTRVIAPVAAALFGCSIGAAEAGTRPGKPATETNPFLSLIEQEHVLSARNARLHGDMTGTGTAESVLAVSDTRLQISDAAVNPLGHVDLPRPPRSFTLFDVDGDRALELLVQGHDGRLRAHGVDGVERTDLDAALATLLRRLDEEAIAGALELAWRRVAPERPDDLSSGDRAYGGFADDTEACDTLATSAPIEWDGALHANGLRLIEGTAGDDVIVGTSADDLIIGHGGNDTICARGGDDWVYGDGFAFDGGPEPVGPAAGDSLFGGPGDDTLHGGPGSDALYGGTGADNLFGGHDVDILYGDGGGYFALPEDYFGQDFLVGMWGDDQVVGGASSDVVNATAFDDVDTETAFAMDPSGGDDSCYVHLNEIFGAAAGGCESVTITDW